MPNKRKLLDKVQRNSKNVSLQEFEALIKQYGYIEEGSKHPKAIIDIYTMPYKRENPIKSCYVVDLIDMIKSLGQKKD